MQGRSLEIFALLSQQAFAHGTHAQSLISSRPGVDILCSNACQDRRLAGLAARVQCPLKASRVCSWLCCTPRAILLHELCPTCVDAISVQHVQVARSIYLCNIRPMHQCELQHTVLSIELILLIISRHMTSKRDDVQL